MSLVRRLLGKPRAEQVVPAARVLFVCMGNICRSPTAEGVFRRVVEQAGFGELVFIDSAGTHDGQIGSPPDRRAQLAAAARGYALSGQARQVRLEDFEFFDFVLAMDSDNFANLAAKCPPALRGKIAMFMDFSARFEDKDVPDPYFGGLDGFETVLDRVEDAAQGLLQHLLDQRFLPPAGAPRSRSAR
jgi:protein-tyrosine phosphatase